MLDFPEIVDVPEVYFETSELPKVTAPTILYGLEPYGIGTGACESLKSYFWRVADAHGVSPLNLLRELYEKLTIQCKYWRLNGANNLKSNPQLISWGKVNRSLTNILTETTGVHGLDLCSMFPIRNLLANIKLISKQERHCPICLTIANQTGTFFGQLIWDIACVTACPIHRVQLVQSKCGASQDKQLKPSSKKVLPGVCSDCGSIGYLCRKEPPIIASDVEVWEAQQVAELISCLPSVSQFFSPQNTIAGLTALVAAFTNGSISRAAFRIGKNPNLLWNWMMGYRLPTLGILLKLCLVSKTSLVSVMRGQPVVVPCPHIEEVQPNRNIQKVPLKDQEAVLHKALAANPPLSMSSVVRELGLSYVTVTRRFPKLCKLVVENYRQFEARKIDERKKLVEQLLPGTVNELANRGISVNCWNFKMITGIGIWSQSKLNKILERGFKELSASAL